MNFIRFLILLLLVQSGITLADSADTGRIGVGRYVTGGVVGTTLGFGIGHSIQDRYWSDYGWAFTASGVLTSLNVMLSISLFPKHTPHCAPVDDDTESLAECEADREKAMREQSAEDSREMNRALMWWLGFKVVEAVVVWWPRNVNFEGVYAKQHEVDSRFIPISKTKYLQGGLLGTLVGFGTGHAVQGRWQRDGWQHTAWQAGAAALATYGWFCKNHSSAGPDDAPDPDSNTEPKPKASYPACDGYPIMMLVGIPLFVALKIVEIASVWEPSPDLYRIVSDNNQQPMFTVAPLLNINQAGVQLVLRI